MIKILSNEAELTSFLLNEKCLFVIGMKNSDITRLFLNSVENYIVQHPDWKVGFMNYDDNKIISIRYGIRIVPNLDVYKSNIFVKRINGVKDEEELFFELNSL